MRKRIVVAAMILLALFLSAPVTPVSAAWEFTMRGVFTWEYEYMTQLGRSGFFGPYDVDNRVSVLTATGHSLNAWLGAEANDMTVSGSDGAWNTMYLDLYPEIRINRVLRLRGRYHIGQWWTGTVASPSATTGVLDSTAGPSVVNSQYFMYLQPGVQRSFSPGYWNTLWLTADLPWGIVAIGKRASTWGMCLNWDGENNRTSESLSLVTDYGPFRIALGLYPARGGYEGYYNDYFDKTGLRYFDLVAPNVTYRNGPLDMGVVLNIGPTRHRGPERLGATGTPETKRVAESRNREDYYGGVYLKYFNGRFFFNSEMDFYNRRDKIYKRSGGVVSTRSNSPANFTHRYIEHFRAAAELGAVTGPSKLSLLLSWSGGPDRRAGIRENINQGLAPPADLGDFASPSGIYPRWISQSSSNTSVYRPYSYLMVYNYGLGAFINADTGNGYVEDAMCYGARLDYAVAANLNVYGSFFWADRVGNGYGWGFLAPNYVGTSPFPPTGSPTGVLTSTFGLVEQRYKGTFNANGTPNLIAPNIPDNNLGWEVDAGLDWKLLEGLTLYATFGYWQPGKWFNFACVSRTNPSWIDPAADTALWGTNPDRSIDPIWGAEIKLIGEF